MYIPLVNNGFRLSNYKQKNMHIYMLNKLNMYFINVKLWSVGSFLSCFIVDGCMLWNLDDLAWPCWPFCFLQILYPTSGRRVWMSWGVLFASAHLSYPIWLVRTWSCCAVFILYCTPCIFAIFCTRLAGFLFISVVWGWLSSHQLKLLKDFILNFKTVKIWFSKKSWTGHAKS